MSGRLFRHRCPRRFPCRSLYWLNYTGSANAFLAFLTSPSGILDTARAEPVIIVTCAHLGKRTLGIGRWRRGSLENVASAKRASGCEGVEFVLQSATLVLLAIGLASSRALSTDDNVLMVQCRYNLRCVPRSRKVSS